MYTVSNTNLTQTLLETSHCCYRYTEQPKTTATNDDSGNNIVNVIACRKK